jgi:hypothetical protein
MFTLQTKLGTASGTLCTLIFLNGGDILRTFILSAVGATASFFISLLLQHMFRKRPKPDSDSSD